MYLEIIFGVLQANTHRNLWALLDKDKDLATHNFNFF